MKCSPDEFLICLLARMLTGVKSVATGASSPIPGAAALLAQEQSGGRMTAMILGSDNHGPFNDGGPELFDRAAQGRIEVFFVGGGQIDGGGNVNLVGTGPYPRATARFPGSFGIPYLYSLVPRIILFREEHSKRVLVPKVDFVTAAGTGPEGVHRTGGPYALVTGRAVFLFDRDQRSFRLNSHHPKTSLSLIEENTGFDYLVDGDVQETPGPADDSLSLLRGTVRDQIAEIYPEFAATRLGGS
ncbi:MAG: CoA synthetase [Rhodospirillaceae bacterium]|jgi:glutaconate CoA-transferase, subunit B|nr:CoA synthetase [Rhodospirillaceae bacterium]